MVVKESTLTKLTITDVPNLDPINAIFEDYGPQRGKVIIEVCGDAWSYFWGAMGEQYAIKSFFLKAGTDYLVRKFKIGIDSTIDDDSQEALQLKAKKEVIQNRRFNGYSKHWARDKWDLIDEISDCGKNENSDILYEIFGEEWYSYLPQKPNPKYRHLCRIVDAIKEALRMPQNCV